MDLKKLESKIRKGNGSFKDINDYAAAYGKKAAKELREQLESEFPNGGITEKDARRIVSGILRKAHKTVSELSAIVINGSYEKAGVELKAVYPKYDINRENDIVKAVLEEYNINELE